MAELSSDTELREVLATVRNVAVLGAHPDPARPAHYVPDYLFRHGYRVVPINAKHAGASLWDETVRKSLTDVETPVDMVDVFRRSEAVAEHVEEILAMQPLPKVVWLQLGIRNDAAKDRLLTAGIDVVQDRCALAEHRRLGVAAQPPRGAGWSPAK